MSCRVEYCEKPEWMARKFCDRHWKMLPLDLQMKIRKLLERRRFGKGDANELQPMIDEALVVIAEREKAEEANAHVTLYRTRMAAVSGLVVTIRQLPFPELRAQLQESIDELLANNLDLYRERRVGIERDAAFLEFFIEVRMHLGTLIQNFAPPAPADEDTVEIHTNAVFDGTPEGVE
jgi:hypothetical protein